MDVLVGESSYRYTYEVIVWVNLPSQCSTDRVMILSRYELVSCILYGVPKWIQE